MRKNKIKKNNDGIVLLIIFLLLSFSYFEINSNLRFGGIIRDFIFTPFKKNYYNDALILINKEIKEENNNLKEMLNISYSLTDFDIINGTVIERNNTYWLDEMTINIGKNDNVSNNQIVIEKNGMVGKVIDVSFNTAKVKLITGFNSPISVNINNDVTKVLFIDNYNLYIRGINDDDNIKINDKVTTSGLSNDFPKGILIGEIEQIKRESSGVGLIAKVKLSANINNIRFVSILKRKNV